MQKDFEKHFCPFCWWEREFVGVPGDTLLRCRHCEHTFTRARLRATAGLAPKPPETKAEQQPRP